MLILFSTFDILPSMHKDKVIIATTKIVSLLATTVTVVSGRVTVNSSYH